ncbi:MAG: hypothetical protein EOP45_09585 [Sphingobacteriaceae bacterium]|nr:MAG: hypothetical protein EOP45_09585 [Sphingobacteriaceae bacterium]
MPRLSPPTIFFLSLSIAIVSTVAFLTVIGVIDWSDKCGNIQNQYWIPQYKKLESESFDRLGTDTFFNQSGVYRFTHHECNGERMYDGAHSVTIYFERNDGIG